MLQEVRNCSFATPIDPDLINMLEMALGSTFMDVIKKKNLWNCSIKFWILFP